MARSVYTSPTFDASRRKVMQYLTLSAATEYQQDVANGHGTHVASVLAGNADRNDAARLIGSDTNSSDDYQGEGLIALESQTAM